MTKARAALADGKGGYRIDEIEVGDPGPGEVQVEVKASGVCHTDFKLLKRQPVVVMGHEGAGAVSKVGKGVTHVRPGDRVLLNWAMPCGKCFQCRRGAENICEAKPSVPRGRFLHRGEPIGTSFDLGTMSTLTVVPRQAVVKIGVKITFSSAAIIGCCVMTGVGTVTNVARVARGSSCAVLGTGGVGLCVIQGARIAGAKTIIGVDVSASRLEMARSFGATHAILADRKDEGLLEAARVVKGLTGGRGADYAFECTSVPALCAAPLSFVRNGGTAVQISGTEEEVTVDFELFEWDKVYLNALYGRCRPRVDMPRILKLYAARKLKLDEMVTRTYSLDDLPKAFEDMHAGRNAKGVLVMSQSSQAGL